MARKSKRQIEEEANFESHKRTIYSAARDTYGFHDRRVMGRVLYEEDMLFAVLVLCGYPHSRAYRAAYPQSKATLQSSAALASRRLREPHIQRILKAVGDKYWDGLLFLCDEACQEAYRKRPKWKPPRRNKITPF